MLDVSMYILHYSAYILLFTVYMYITCTSNSIDVKTCKHCACSCGFWPFVAAMFRTLRNGAAYRCCFDNSCDAAVHNGYAEVAQLDILIVQFFVDAIQ